MDLDDAIDRVLLAIFKAAGLNADIAVNDSQWLRSVKSADRQQALETCVTRLVQSGMIRREPGTAAVTARGLAYVNAHPVAWRKAG